MSTGGTILVVDDDEAMLETLSDILESECYRVLTAPSGAAALESLRSADVDLVLLDVMMPGINGLETLRHIRACDKYDGVPVVLMSAAYGGAELGGEPGAAGFLQKPFDLAELFAVISSLI
jgi:DNA-binding response OmpR family regulator